MSARRIASVLLGPADRRLNSPVIPEEVASRVAGWLGIESGDVLFPVAAFPGAEAQVQDSSWIFRIQDPQSMTNPAVASRRCGRPLSDGEICCALSHRILMASLASYGTDGIWRGLSTGGSPDMDFVVDVVAGRYQVPPTGGANIWTVVLEDDAAPCHGASPADIWGYAGRAFGCARSLGCSLLHGGKASPRPPAPIPGIRRYGTYSMVFTMQGVRRCLSPDGSGLARNPITSPVDDIYMESRAFQCPSSPLFSHDDDVASTLGCDRRALQARMRAGEFRSI